MSLLFIERLTLWSWGQVWPRMFWWRVSGRKGLRRCYAIDASCLGLIAAKSLGRLLGVPVDVLQFRLLDIRDDRGLLMRLRIAYQDLEEAQADVLGEPEFRALQESGTLSSEAQIFLAKNAATLSLSRVGTMGRALLLIQLCLWTSRQEGKSGEQPLLCMARRPWCGALAQYAMRRGVRLLQLHPGLGGPKVLLHRLIGPRGLDAFQGLRHTLAVWRFTRRHRRQGVEEAPTLATNGTPSCRMAVEYYGHLNLEHPERYSDLFFWQQARLAACSTLVTFHIPSDPLDEQKWSELTAHGIGAVALHPSSAAGMPVVPVWLHRPRYVPVDRRVRRMLRGRRLETRWIRGELETYTSQRAFWEAFFTAHRVKVYTSWFKYDASHCVIADAMRRSGGATVIYQRAYESHPSVETTIAADIVFGFSPGGAELERRSHSHIGYYVATGYLGDHRVPLLRAQARQVREQLQRAGARRVVAFSDENSHDDERWSLGHTVMRESYAFLFHKVLAEPWLGLVLKPKRPANLRRRLGPVATLLAQAEATGRCFVYEEGALHGTYPPAAAALAADVMIHGHLCAATAGMESALAGVPTLLLDREGWAVSPCYRLGVGRVVFHDWDTLWQACLESWSRPEGVPGFGDWSPMLNELDPFRDGRAAERMGTYLRWLLEGFEAHRDREAVMAEAAERYTAQWGKDKVTSVNQPPGRRPASVSNRSGEPREVLVYDA